MEQVLISVVIPTFNRADLLARTLESLAAQTLGHEFFEVIVVDDGGQDHSQAIVDSFSYRMNVKYFWQEDKGFRAGKARNIGTCAADGKYIVYIDTGVLLTSNALQAHLDLHSKSQYPLVVIGYVYGFETDGPLVDEMLASASEINVDSTIDILRTIGALDVRELQYQELGDNISSWPAPFDIFWTCHVSAERQALFDAGLFDESFNSWGGEDVDLGVRLFNKNNMFLMDRSVCSFHWPHKKEVDDQRIHSENAALRIHKKYNLWTTSFYGMDLNDRKYSLNKVIKIHREYDIKNIAERQMVGAES